MSAQESNSVDITALLAALAQARDLCQRLGLPNEAGNFQRFIIRYQEELPTYPVLKDEIHSLTSGIPALRILAKLKGDHSEYNRMQDAFGRLLFPEIHEEQKRPKRSLEERIEDHCDKVMASSAKAEARQWLRKRSHGFFKTNPTDVSGFVEKFYAAGAQEVLIGQIEQDRSAQVGQCLLVILPKKSTARAKLFEIGSRAEDAFQCDHVSDKGQKYLYYPID